MKKLFYCSYNVSIFIYLDQVILQDVLRLYNFKSVDEILWLCYHSNKMSLAETSTSTIHFLGFYEIKDIWKFEEFFAIR